MKPIIWIRLFICCAVVGPFRAVEARNVRSVLQEEGILRFDRTVLDVGTLTEDDAPQTYRFTCTNVSGKTREAHPCTDNLRLYGGGCPHGRDSSG